MKTFKIYTAGKMGGLEYEDQMLWRWKLELCVRETANNVVFVHPPQYYRYEDNFHKNEREAMQWDLAQIRDSDIVVVDMNTIADSIGTHMELGFIEAINQMGSKHIHVIAIGNPNVEHPWLYEIPLRFENSVESAADYITSYLLV